MFFFSNQIVHQNVLSISDVSFKIYCYFLIELVYVFNGGLMCCHKFRHTILLINLDNTINTIHTEL